MKKSVNESIKGFLKFTYILSKILLFLLCKYFIIFRVEKKALIDETPSKDVYHQLQSLSKQNPWFVQSLQSIMTQNILAEDNPSMKPSQSPDAPTGESPASVSNHAVLALLLAAYLKPSHGVQQGTASLSNLIKQLESG